MEFSRTQDNRADELRDTYDAGLVEESDLDDAAITSEHGSGDGDDSTAHEPDWRHLLPETD